MTQIDNAPTVEQLRRALADEPCPNCGGNGGWGTGEALIYDGSIDVEICDVCQGTGRAFPWASEHCFCMSKTCWIVRGRIGQHEDNCGCEDCNGSGRVPKAVGLEELLEREYMVVIEALSEEFIKSGPQDRAPDYTLAALRAIAAQAGMQ